MRRTAAALLGLTLWIAALGVMTIFVQRRLEVSSDLRLFLPSPTTREKRLLLEDFGEGPASRVLVVALDGATPEELADVSRALVAALRGGEKFRFVTNGEVSLDSLPDELLPYRFLLSRTFDDQPLNAEFLEAQLVARTRDLASPAGLILEPWLPRDPTLELPKLLESWQPLREPRREFDVWFDGAGARALLVAETRAPAFDPAGQRAAIEELERMFGALDARGSIHMTVSGAGKFSDLMETRTRAETTRLGGAATIGMIILLLLAYRRIGSVILTLLPLASAGLAGLAAVSALFGSVHGITLAFGFTLIGVAQDYPIHLLSHRRPDAEPDAVARALWPTLATGIASTCISYLTFLFSGVLGLAQLACFTVIGLAVAGLTTRYLLPSLTDKAGSDHGNSLLLQRLWDSVARLPHPGWAGGVLVVLCVGIVALAPQPLWENALGGLTPVPADLLAQDQELRAQLGTADLRYMLAVTADDEETALESLEKLDAPLRELVQRGAIRGYDHAARYVPAAATQRIRQAKLPDAQALRAMLETAQARSPFRAGVFEPFLEDVTRARELAPLTVEQIGDTALGTEIELLLRRSSGAVTALVTLSGVDDAGALQQLALKAASESLVVRQRTRILWMLGAASILLVGVVAFALRSGRRVARVIAPM